MGAKSFIVEGKGNKDSFESCAHGAGRKMSRSKAKRMFTLDDHIAATAGVECRKDTAVIDETPGAYKDIDAVMAGQRDLVTIRHTLKQVGLREGVDKKASGERPRCALVETVRRGRPIWSCDSRPSVGDHPVCRRFTPRSLAQLFDSLPFAGALIAPQPT